MLHHFAMLLATSEVVPFNAAAPPKEEVMLLTEVLLLTDVVALKEEATQLTTAG